MSEWLGNILMEGGGVLNNALNSNKSSRHPSSIHTKLQKEEKKCNNTEHK